MTNASTRMTGYDSSEIWEQAYLSHVYRQIFNQGQTPVQNTILACKISYGQNMVKTDVYQLVISFSKNYNAPMLRQTLFSPHFWKRSYLSKKHVIILPQASHNPVSQQISYSIVGIKDIIIVFTITDFLTLPYRGDPPSCGRTISFSINLIPLEFYRVEF